MLPSSIMRWTGRFASEEICIPSGSHEAVPASLPYKFSRVVVAQQIEKEVEIETLPQE